MVLQRRKPSCSVSDQHPYELGPQSESHIICEDSSIGPTPQITVDGDTSTNDTVLGLASGAAGGALISDHASPEAAQLEAAVTALLQVGDRPDAPPRSPPPTPLPRPAVGYPELSQGCMLGRAARPQHYQGPDLAWGLVLVPVLSLVLVRTGESVCPRAL